MNNVTQEEKDSVTKTLAIIGFIAAILFAVWLAVQIVSVIPSAFSSLASIADGVYNYNEDQSLTVATKNSVVNTGEAFTVSWTEMNRPGAYTFMYECTDGAALDVRNAQGEIVSLDCGEKLFLEDATSLDIMVTSEKQRFTDIAYAVTYTPNDEDGEAFTTRSKVTIVNASIPTSAAIADTEEEEATETEVPEITQVGSVAGESTSSNNSGNTGATAGTPTTVEEIIYAIPTSDPNGKIDLQVTYLGVGELDGKTFRRTATIDRDEQGAFQFEVKNIGTKTASDWSYEAELPSGIEYDAGDQDALKPNEKAIITIGFEGLTQLGTEKFGAEVTAKNDVNKSNNSFSWAVEVVK